MFFGRRTAKNQVFRSKNDQNQVSSSKMTKNRKKNPTKSHVGCGLFSIFDVGVATHNPTPTCGPNSTPADDIVLKLFFKLRGEK